jgi:4-amino-4-deoxy-L-arabinose transferase-like glycosyltransferase
MATQTVKRKAARRRVRRQAWLDRRDALIAMVWGRDAAAAESSETRALRVRAHAVAIATFALFAIATTWPVVTRLGTHVPSDGGDALMNYWGYWWVREAIGSGQNPFETPLLYAPYGAPLYLHTLAPLNAVLSLPFQLLFGPTVAYNLLVLLLFVLAAYGAFLLGSHLTGNRAAGMVAGIIYAFGSYQMTHLLGHTNLLATGWIPLTVLCLVRAFETTGRRRTGFAVGVAGGLLALALSDWQYVIFTALMLAFLTIWWAATRRSVAPLVVAACSAALWLLVVAPLLLATLDQLRSGIAETPDPGTAKIYSADVMSFILPAERHVIWGEWAKEARFRLPAPPVEGDVFLGFIPLALGLWALVFDRRRAAPWVLAGLGFAILALGPLLHIRGDWRWDGPNGTLRTIPMPFSLAQELPIVNLVRVPIRFTLMVTLALAALGALAIAQIARRWPTLQRPARAVPLVGLLAMLLVAEHLATPFPLEATTVPQFYCELARSDEQGTILEWPLSFKRARSDFYQTVHGRPIMGGYVARRLAYPVRALPPFRSIPTQADDIYAIPATASNIGPWVLQWSGVRWVVFFRNDPAFNPQDLATFQERYADGGPIYQDAEVIVFRPRSPTGAATMIVGGGGWSEREMLGDTQTPLRWFERSAQFNIWHFGEDMGNFALRFDAWSFHQPRRLEVWVDGQRLGEWRVTETQRFDLPLSLANGPHLVELRSLDPPVSPASVGYSGGDTRPLAFAISNVRLER